jgi:hypothetical protein
MDNLPQLRDIHLPPETIFFPLGYGWLIVFAALILLYILYRLAKFLYQKSKKRYALMLLKRASADNLDSVRQISEILRRICLYRYKNAAAYYGNDWILFLNNHAKKPLLDSAAQLLLYAPYMAQNKKYPPEVYRALREFAKNWIGENL